MEVCYEYVGFIRWWYDLGSEGQAAWLSAVGGLLAIGLTAWFYFKDRRERIRSEAEVAASHQRDRAYRAWKLALRMFPIVEGGTTYLEWIKSRFADPSFDGVVFLQDRPQWEPTDPGKLENLMRDMADLSKDTQAKLIFFVNLLDLFRLQFQRWTATTGGAFNVEQLRQFMPSIEIAIASGKSASKMLEEEVDRNSHAAG